MLESRAERSALGTAPDVAVVDVGLNFLCPKTYPLNHTSKKTNYPSTTAAQEACFDFARMIFIFATRPESEAQNRIRIIISLLFFSVNLLFASIGRTVNNQAGIFKGNSKT